jgi:protein-tyrosine phosphatase
VKTVLFLCTGNYYRSRFAEELFNHRASHAGINWQAQSRALAIERGINNMGPVSPFALRGLTARGLSAKGANRPPRQCVILDLESANYIVALNEVEHRPLMSERFPNWESRIKYWAVGDVDLVQPNRALAMIDVQVDALLVSFSRPDNAIVQHRHA